MSTNYYLNVGCCKCCKCFKEQIHIGKSSNGWAFLLRYDEERSKTSLEDWERSFLDPENQIVDEYGSILEYVEMIQIIFNRKGTGNLTPEWMKVNQACYGNNGLAMPNHNRVKSKNGTYAMVEGNFC